MNFIILPPDKKCGKTKKKTKIKKQSPQTPYLWTLFFDIVGSVFRPVSYTHLDVYKRQTLDNLFSQIAEGEMKELAIVVKADVQGSAEAVKQSLEKLSNEEEMCIRDRLSSIRNSPLSTT